MDYLTQGGVCNLWVSANHRLGGWLDWGVAGLDVLALIVMIYLRELVKVWNKEDNLLALKSETKKTKGMLGINKICHNPITGFITVT
jgi:hypothetical protein